uniref:pentatricopeptide repeat-containing protein At1g80150, mitochondrial isoform X2 n=1 Tax=Fragaria vesca subsp. vesca TaxID=101020 RepID=UPI0005C8DDCB|nr:PREDICTED: pentatricopeptide repeat-containing protein At1g80150, mitochondrial isoform X2 [Fragaria vesca subsp. vesca]
MGGEAVASRRFCHVVATAVVARNHCAAAAAASVPNSVSNNIKASEEPALVKLKAERDPEKLFQLFKANSHNRLVIENRFAFEDTVARLAGARRFDYIEHLLEHQKSLPQGRREGFVMRIITLYGKAGMTKHAVDTFCDMHLYGCSRTVKSYNATLKVLTQTRDLRAIEAFMSDIPQQFDIQLDVYSVNIVIKAFCEMGDLTRAYVIMVEMEKLGIRPDVITYTTLISAFYKCRRWEIANGLWNLMVLKRCLPNLATFNVRIQFLVDTKRAWEANRVMRMMQNIGIAPDEVTFNLVIKGFCQAGKLDMAKRVYSFLHDKGYKPNVKIYQTMIHYLCRERDFNLAYTICRNCMQKNWYPNVDTIRTLLEGLNRNSQLGKAQAIMTLVRRRVPPFPSKQLSSLQSILTKS